MATLGCALCLFVVSAAQAGYLELAWDAPSANLDGSPLTDLFRYRIYFATRSPACGGASFKELASLVPNPKPGESVTTSLTGLVEGVTYFVQVSAVDSSGNESLCSNEATGLAKADQADTTTPPTGSLTINENALYTVRTEATLNLGASHAVGVTGYYVSTGSTTPAVTAPGWISIPSTTTFRGDIFYALSSGDGVKTVYAWYKDAAGNVSSRVSASITLDQTPPSTGVLTATAASGQITLTWSGISDGGSGLASGTPYTLVYATGGLPAAACTSGTPLAPGTSTTLTHTGLTNGTTYYYRLCVLDKAGNISPGATALATAGRPDTTSPNIANNSPTKDPSSPTVNSPTPGSTLPGASATFSWTAGGVGAQEYWLYVGSTVGGYDYFTHSTGAARSQVVSGLPTDGRPVFVRLWWRTGPSWNSSSDSGYTDYTYTTSQ